MKNEQFQQQVTQTLTSLQDAVDTQRAMLFEMKTSFNRYQKTADSRMNSMLQTLNDFDAQMLASKETIQLLTDKTTAAIRISRKAAREIGEHMNQRVMSFGLPYTEEETMRHIRPSLVAALRKKFGGVNSYYDLCVNEVEDAYTFIDVWSPSIELLEKVAAQLRGPQIHVTVETKRWNRMSGGTNGGNARKR